MILFIHLPSLDILNIHFNKFPGWDLIPEVCVKEGSSAYLQISAYLQM